MCLLEVYIVDYCNLICVECCLLLLLLFEWYVSFVLIEVDLCKVVKVLCLCMFKLVGGELLLYLVFVEMIECVCVIGIVFVILVMINGLKFGEMFDVFW